MHETGWDQYPPIYHQIQSHTVFLTLSMAFSKILAVAEAFYRVCLKLATSQVVVPAGTKSFDLICSP